MTMHVGVGGAYKDVITAHVGVGGAWKSVLEIYVGVGGAWKLGYVLIVTDLVDASGLTSCSASFSNSGTMTATDGTDFTWLPGGTASDFDIYVSGTGTTPTGPALDTWHNLGTTRTWSLSTGATSKTFTGTYQIRHSSSGVVLGSNNFYLSVSGTA